MNNTDLLPAETRIGSIEIAVKNINRITEFYHSFLGLELLRWENKSVFLGTSKNNGELIILSERKDLKAPSKNSPGLFHLALLVPSRKELAKTFLHLNELAVRPDGFSNHGVSEAIYLRDQEGKGIEIYSDTPETLWNCRNDEIQMVTEPLNLKKLLSTIDNGTDQFEGLHSKSYIGHIHLKVSSIEKAKKFYNDTIGFNVTQSDYPGAIFMAAGKYHHHIGANMWMSKNSTPSDEETLGLQKYSVVLPDLLSLNKLSFRLLEAGTPLIEQDSHSILIKDLDGIKVEFKTKQS